MQLKIIIFVLLPLVIMIIFSRRIRVCVCVPACVFYPVMPRVLTSNQIYLSDFTYRIISACMLLPGPYSLQDFSAGICSEVTTCSSLE